MSCGRHALGAWHEAFQVVPKLRPNHLRNSGQRHARHAQKPTNKKGVCQGGESSRAIRRGRHAHGVWHEAFRVHKTEAQQTEAQPLVPYARGVAPRAYGTRSVSRRPYILFSALACPNAQPVPPLAEPYRSVQHEAVADIRPAQSGDGHLSDTRRRRTFVRREANADILNVRNKVAQDIVRHQAAADILSVRHKAVTDICPTQGGSGHSSDGKPMRTLCKCPKQSGAGHCPTQNGVEQLSNAKWRRTFVRHNVMADTVW